MKLGAKSHGYEIEDALEFDDFNDKYNSEHNEGI
jgi:hypothetical protein